VSDGQFWLALFVGLLVGSALVSFSLARRAELLGCLPVPLAASVAVTLYAFIFDRDPQAPVFLVMFYAVAAIAGAFGLIVGRAAHRHWRQ